MIKARPENFPDGLNFSKVSDPNMDNKPFIQQAEKNFFGRMESWNAGPSPLASFILDNLKFERIGCFRCLWRFLDRFYLFFRLNLGNIGLGNGSIRVDNGQDQPQQNEHSCRSSLDFRRTFGKCFFITEFLLYSLYKPESPYSYDADQKSDDAGIYVKHIREPDRPLCQETMEGIRQDVARDFEVVDMRHVSPLLSEEVVFLLQSKH